MAHLSALARLLLAVEVQPGGGIVQHSIPLRLAVFPQLAEEVHHRDAGDEDARLAEGQPADRGTCCSNWLTRHTSSV